MPAIGDDGVEIAVTVDISQADRSGEVRLGTQPSVRVSDQPSLLGLGRTGKEVDKLGGVWGASRSRVYTFFSFHLPRRNNTMPTTAERE